MPAWADALDPARRLLGRVPGRVVGVDRVPATRAGGDSGLDLEPGGVAGARSCILHRIWSSAYHSQQTAAAAGPRPARRRPRARARRVARDAAFARAPARQARHRGRWDVALELQPRRPPHRRCEHLRRAVRRHRRGAAPRAPRVLHLRPRRRRRSDHGRPRRAGACRGAGPPPRRCGRLGAPPATAPGPAAGGRGRGGTVSPPALLELEAAHQLSHPPQDRRRRRHHRLHRWRQRDHRPRRPAEPARLPRQPSPARGAGGALVADHLPRRLGVRDRPQPEGSRLFPRGRGTRRPRGPDRRLGTRQRARADQEDVLRGDHRRRAARARAHAVPRS